ncbi:DoxX family protein [Streptomyces fuscichromogenes]|uniref:DoxX family protein n=1 Tax=Streptomyces fuscichromogenes TaxID=1324013 RepID=UPI0037F87BDD
MNVTLWIAAGLLAFAFLGAGAMKLAKSKEQLLASGPTMAWAEDFSPGMIRLIGFAEVLGAIGLLLPPALDVATVFVPLAATGLAVTMAGAVIEHARRKEFQALAAPVVLLALAVFVAWGRFGPHSF